MTFAARDLRRDGGGNSGGGGGGRSATFGPFTFMGVGEVVSIASMLRDSKIPAVTMPLVGKVTNVLGVTGHLMRGVTNRLDCVYGLIYGPAVCCCGQLLLLLLLLLLMLRMLRMLLMLLLLVMVLLGSS